MVAPGGGGHAWLLQGRGACVVAQGVCMIARGHAWLLPGGMCGCSGGGVHGCSQGGMHGCSLGGHAWLLWGVGVCGCSQGVGGMCGCSRGGHAWLLWGGKCGCSWGAMHGFFQGEGMHGFSGGGMHRIRRDTVNEQAVRILLECILVLYVFDIFWQMHNCFTKVTTF